MEAVLNNPVPGTPVRQLGSILWGIAINQDKPELVPLLINRPSSSQPDWRFAYPVAKTAESYQVDSSKADSIYSDMAEAGYFDSGTEDFFADTAQYSSRWPIDRSYGTQWTR